MSSTRLEEPIKRATAVIQEQIEKVVESQKQGLLQYEFPSSDLSEELALSLEQCVQQDTLSYNMLVPAQTPEEDKEALQKEVDAFNAALPQRIKETVYANSFESVLAEYLGRIVEHHRNKDKSHKDVHQEVVIKDKKVLIVVDDVDIPSFNRMFVALDFVLFMVSKDKALKRIFHRLVSTISESLIEVSSKQLSVFWYYMESIVPQLSMYVFDKAVTGDRIALLEICNPLTDKYYRKTDGGKNNTYKKDSFNDVLQSRIRFFVNDLLSLEDNTGLNKYFSVSGRVVPEADAFIRPTGFVRDVINCLKLFRDPYGYIKPNRIRDLREASQACRRVLEQLMDEEIPYLRKNSTDPFRFKDPVDDSEKQYLQSKYSEIEFFPEIYWQGVFKQEDNVSEKEARDDSAQVRDIMEDAKLREAFIVQIVLMCNFFSEMSSTLRKQFLQDLPAKTKHITDDVANEQIAASFGRMKRQAIKEFRDVDSSFSFLLLNILVLERHWWKWLVYSKDPKTQQPLLASKHLTPEDLQSADEKFQSLFPVKEKRYFNVYATPQLSRRMRGKRGLESIEIHRWSDDAMEEDDESKPEELKNVRMWKRFRSQRQHKWLQFGDLLTSEVLGEEEIGRKAEEIEEQKEQPVGAEDVKEDVKDKETEEKAKDIEQAPEPSVDAPSESASSPQAPAPAKTSENGSVPAPDAMDTDQ